MKKTFLSVFCMALFLFPAWGIAAGPESYTAEGGLIENFDSYSTQSIGVSFSDADPLVGAGCVLAGKTTIKKVTGGVKSSGTTASNCVLDYIEAQNYLCKGSSCTNWSAYGVYFNTAVKVGWKWRLNKSATWKSKSYHYGEIVGWYSEFYTSLKKYL